MVSVLVQQWAVVQDAWLVNIFSLAGFWIAGLHGRTCMLVLQLGSPQTVSAA
jgi:hypothetical protein